MATNKKNQAVTEPAKAPVAEAAAPKAKIVRPRVAKPAAANPPAAKKTVARKPAAAKPAKPLDPAVQASKEALAKALAAAQAVKITKPLGKPAKAEKAEKAPKVQKAKKAKLVRDSFTMPEGEYEQIAALKKRLLAQGMVSKKSELLRAGVAMLVGLTDSALVAAMQKVEVIKTGRPAKSGK